MADSGLAGSPPCSFQVLVFLVMVTMKGMLVAVVDVVHMVIMLDGFVPAAGPVLVLSKAMGSRIRPIRVRR